jgi:DNA-binding response OmpR family regulator
MDNKKVLVVDDDPYILMSLEFLMQKNGFRVMVARNGSEALSLIASQVPDLILLDIMMPDVDGYSICRQVKSNPEWKHIQVVFLSAKTREADIQKGLDLGASLYVVKPFSTRDLMKKIKLLLGIG